MINWGFGVLGFWIYVDSATSNFWARSSVLQFQDAELTESMVNTSRNSITQLRRFVPTENGGIGVACLVQFVVHFWICFIFKLDLQNWSKLPNSPNLGSWTCRTSNLHNSDLPLLIVDRCRCCGTTTATRASPAAIVPPFYRVFLQLQHRIGCWSWRNNNFRRLHDGRGRTTRCCSSNRSTIGPQACCSSIEQPRLRWSLEESKLLDCSNPWSVLDLLDLQTRPSELVESPRISNLELVDL